MYPYMAMISGFLGGLIYFGASKCVLKVCKIDDPLDAFAVHGACGFWGVLAVGFFSASDYAYASGPGLFYGGGNAIVAAIVALLAETAWVLLMSFGMFFPLKLLG